MNTRFVPFEQKTGRTATEEIKHVVPADPDACAEHQRIVHAFTQSHMLVQCVPAADQTIGL